MRPSRALLAGSSRSFTILGLPLANIPRPAPHPIPTSRPPIPATSSSPTPSPVSHTPSSPSTTAASDSDTSSHPKISGSATSPSSPSGRAHPIILFQPLQPPPSPSSGPVPYTTRALNYASDTWLKLGQKDPKTWMYWFWKQGEGLMDRIEYEEWALKGVVEGQGVKVEKGKVVKGGDIKIPLLRPSAKLVDAPPMLPQLHRHLLHRIPHHRQRMWRFILFIPITAPFAIVPVIPNFPMYYAMWRAWSHYKAYRGATYLEALVKSGLVVEKEDGGLDSVYAQRKAVREAAQAAVEAAQGGENRAPDATSGGVVTPAEEKEGGETVSEEAAKGLPGQAKGEGPAPDGTATPSSQLFPKSDSDSTPSSSTSASPKPTPKPTPLSPSELAMRTHPALLLTRPQVASLASSFSLQPHEVVDVNRAVEQAYLRAKKVEDGNKGVEKEVKGEVEASTKWRGNLHR